MEWYGSKMEWNGAKIGLDNTFKHLYKNHCVFRKLCASGYNTKCLELKKGKILEKNRQKIDFWKRKNKKNLGFRKYISHTAQALLGYSTAIFTFYL